MRVFASCIAVALCAACGQATAPESSSSAPAPSTSVVFSVTPANVLRARTTLPPDYELSALPADATPTALWGIGQNWTSEPPDCAGTVTPIAADIPVNGWSASGPGGIVYVVAAEADVGTGPAIPADCLPWTMFTDHTDAVMAFADAPVIAGATTLGLTTDLTSKVEAGTETHSRAETFVAYLGAYVAYVVIVTDPGASGPPLDPGFASNLLVETVSAIRS
jgi:Domain of unknown function (DUF5642)